MLRTLHVFKTAVLCVTLGSGVVYAQYYGNRTGAGQTTQPSQQYQRMLADQQRRASTYYYQPAPPTPQPVYRDPTQSPMYRALAPLEPYAVRGERFGQGAMRCGIGGLGGSAGGPVGTLAGCAAGIFMRSP